MNKLETQYSQVLNDQKARGEIRGWRFQALKLRLADATFYTPDFWVIDANGQGWLHEVKGGHWEDDARVKIKVAAELFREFAFVAVQRIEGRWQYEFFASETVTQPRDAAQVEEER